MAHIVVRPRCQLACDRLTAVGCLRGQAYEGFNTVLMTFTNSDDGWTLCVMVSLLAFTVRFKLYTNNIACTTSIGHCLHEERAFWKGV